MALAPLRQFGLRSALVTTLQAVSGAGYPGVASLDIVGNVIPFIDGEEDKIETETKKILGCKGEEAIEPHEVTVSAHTTRVPVINGHTEMISVSLKTQPAAEEVLAALVSFSGRPQQQQLPSAPPRPIVYLKEANRPQPRLDVDRGQGMTVSIGRLRRCSVLDYKFVALGHNTVRGAARGRRAERRAHARRWVADLTSWFPARLIFQWSMVRVVDWMILCNSKTFCPANISCGARCECAVRKSWLSVHAIKPASVSQ